MFCFFSKSFFAFSKLFRIILGPQKHVLRLICSILGISTAIKTALKVALYVFFDGLLASLNGKFMEKVNHYNRTNQIDFSMGPSVKLSDATFFLVGPNISISINQYIGND